ncbi:hypothetical protein BAS06_09350 [Elizabethkingia miricola]|uniref:hypothetical protein n=1 Tax=Elizabethkingia miricola TaxID=172045 RepID=UPI000999792B|nr:hypothetical protein [Elizabethkingia miricola]MDV3880743.1 hypothetical protein [Elizabethkingia anophelis]OPB90514.1 hypothetical protein BAS06_09350 [Elizabethkingia miricola]
MVTTANYIYWVKIKIHSGSYPTDPVIELFYWEFPWHVRTKWNWYFKYRAALAQVKYPKSLVVFKWGNKEPDTRTKLDFLKSQVTAKKRMITKLSNEISKHEEWLHLNNIFGISGDDGRLEKAEIKLDKYQCELKELENEINNLNNF